MPETVVHFQIRMPPDLHEKLSSRARLENRSLNALVVAILQASEEAAQGEGTTPTEASKSAR